MILTTKQSEGWTNEDGSVVAPHTLYRYVDANGKGGCWYAKIENGRRSWDRSHAPQTLAGVPGSRLDPS